MTANYQPTINEVNYRQRLFKTLEFLEVLADEIRVTLGETSVDPDYVEACDELYKMDVVVQRLTELCQGDAD